MSDSSDSDAAPTPEVNDEKAERRKMLLEKLHQRQKRKRSNTEDGGAVEEDDYKIVTNPLSGIKNKERRNQLFKKMQQQKKKEQKTERRRRKREGHEPGTSHTIESLRETDHTAITQLGEAEADEVQQDLNLDEFSNYFNKEYEPKVLITHSDRPCQKSRVFARELFRIFPNSTITLRNRMTAKKLCKSAIREGFTDMVIIHEDNKEPNGLLLIHLPDGPTAHFKLSNVKLTNELRKSHKEITKHRPEVILTNFTTRLGFSIGRMLGSLFHYDPEFRGRRVATFHNQRDYIFFRHHRYEFTKDGERAKLVELGPRFTLKLRSLQQGLFDSKTGDYEWIISNKRHMMEQRRRFFL